MNFKRAILKGVKLKKEGNVPYCYGCGKSDHLKRECSELTKVSRKSNFDFNGKRKVRKAYNAQKNNDNSSTQSDSDNSEVIHSDFEFESNPCYEELRQALVDMHGDAIKAFEKLISLKKIIPKLKVELSQHKNDFECLKDEYASLVDEKIAIPCIEPPKENSPKYDSNWIDLASCETCHSLHEEIKSLTRKLEQASKAPIVFAMNSKNEKAMFKRPYKSTLMFKTTKIIENSMDLTLDVTIVQEVVIPYLIATLERLKFLRG